MQDEICNFLSKVIPQNIITFRFLKRHLEYSLATVKLKKGIHILTLKTVSHGNMNYDNLEFKIIK